MSSQQVDHFITKISSFAATREAKDWRTLLLSLVLSLLALALTAVYLDIRRGSNRPPPPAGCRRLGIDPERSNFRDQFDSKYGKKLAQGDGATCRVKALTIHPIKSCYPVELSHGEVVGEGMRYDRQLTFAQLISSLPKAEDPKVSHQWTFMTQRANRNMTKIKTEMWVPDPSSPTYSPDGEWVKNDGCIVVSFPYVEDDKSSLIFKLEQMGNYIRRNLLRQRGLDCHGPRIYFRVPFHPSVERIKEKGHTFESVKIWTDCPVALNMGIEIDPEILEKLRYALGMSNPVTLMRIDPNRYREVFRCAPRKGEGVSYQPIVGMQDAYPLHIMNFASVQDLAGRVGNAIDKLDARRFRANIYVTGAPAFAEDHWKVIRIGKARFHVACRTARCMLPNVNPETAERHPAEPNKTMKAYRVIDEGANPHACLGMQMVPFSNEVQEIKVGDEVVVEEVGEHFYIKQS
ncbi:MOSC domain-containing protein [Phyllosticta citribraziliensis]|uniref:MOSC domain-containing protein n=1 Tax=Phyllosticta citribraziliensis TaxID=989973 RepID=A0ABR1M6R6_9PEZI